MRATVSAEALAVPRLAAGAALGLFLLLAVSCSDEPGGPAATRAGSLEVQVRTTGGDVDVNGYRVTVGAGVQRHVATNASVVITGISADDYLVALQGVAENCLVTGEHPRAATVVAGGMAYVVFEVHCATTGIEVSVRTTGQDIPDAYALLVDGRSAPIGANGSQVVSRLTAGQYAVTLVVPGNCTVTGGPEITVVVSNRSVTAVPIAITCLALARPEKLAFVLDSVANGYARQWIAVANPDQTTAVVLAKGHSPDWSPDGARLVYADSGCIGWDDEQPCSVVLFVLDLERQIISGLSTAGLATEPAWNPAGDVIAFIRPGEPGLGADRLYLVKLDGSPAVEIPTPGVTSARNPAWSPDGQRIAFTCVVRAGSQDVCVINRNGTGFMRLTNQRSYNADPAWSPNGRTIAFTTTSLQSPWDYDGATDVALMAADGSGITRITSGSGAAWLPDGSILVFVGPNGDGLFTVKPDGSSLTRLTTGRHHSPAWRRRGGDPCLGCWDPNSLSPFAP